eukprot:8653241-Prorocentrum_lima.AAC.1
MANMVWTPFSLSGSPQYSVQQFPQTVPSGLSSPAFFGMGPSGQHLALQHYVVNRPRQGDNKRKRRQRINSAGEPSCHTDSDSSGLDAPSPMVLAPIGVASAPALSCG